MKKIITILGGLLLIAASCAMLFFAAAIYDTGNRIVIEPYFFQPDDLSSRRVGRPMTATELGPDKMRDMLLRRFVTEYFYVIPNSSNVSNRMGGTKSNPFARMARPEVFQQWKNTVAPEIQEMAAAGKLRLVRFYEDGINNGITHDKINNFWQINFDMHTWNVPNDLSVAPEITHHTMFVRVDINDALPKTIKKNGNS